MNFILDKHFSPHKAVFLNHIVRYDGHTVVHLDNKFPQDISDENIVRELGKEGGWIMLTCDDHFRKDPLVREALDETKLTALIFPKSHGDQVLLEKATRTLKAWPEIVKIAKEHPSNFVARLTANYKLPK